MGIDLFGRVGRGDIRVNAFLRKVALLAIADTKPENSLLV